MPYCGRETTERRVIGMGGEPVRFGSTIVSRETSRGLSRLCELIRGWNGTVRLVSAGDLAVLDQRHVANSLCLVPMLNQLQPGSVIDIGSGGGFPGLVIAIATGIPVHLVESDLRKAAFLREAARLIGVDATVHAQRIEAMSLQADVVTSRAFAPLHRLWPIAAARLKRGGRGLFLSGRSVPEEARSRERHGLIWTSQDGTVFEVAAE